LIAGEAADSLPCRDFLRSNSNVVARWIDPDSNQPSGAYAAASVSVFLFAGNVETTVTGAGQPFNRYGSNQSTLEGFFDLAGLQIPNGGSEHSIS
jgi:hypothetical protein